MNRRIASIFISHSAREPDHTVTKGLADALQNAGFDVWWDKEGLEGGEFFPVEILEAIIRQHFSSFRMQVASANRTSGWPSV